MLLWPLCWSSGNVTVTSVLELRQCYCDLCAFCRWYSVPFPCWYFSFLNFVAQNIFNASQGVRDLDVFSWTSKAFFPQVSLTVRNMSVQRCLSMCNRSYIVFEALLGISKLKSYQGGNLCHVLPSSFPVLLLPCVMALNEGALPRSAAGLFPTVCSKFLCSKGPSIGSGGVVLKLFCLASACSFELSFWIFILKKQLGIEWEINK